MTTSKRAKTHTNTTVPRLTRSLEDAAGAFLAAPPQRPAAGDPSTRKSKAKVPQSKFQRLIDAVLAALPAPAKNAKKRR